MSTLLLRLAAPLQAWGSESKFDVRRTGREPTKSGVTGLLAAALGRRRDEPIDDLAALRFGVRTDQEGTLLRDFHTAKSTSSAYVTTRYYLSDAVFLVGLESDEEALLRSLDEAVRHPYYPLFLGRRSCPPAGRVSLGVRALPLREALENEPWLAPEWRQRRLDSALRVTVETQPGRNTACVRDMPISFSPIHRRFGFRAAEQCEPKDMRPALSRAEHDAMAELR